MFKRISVLLACSAIGFVSSASATVQVRPVAATASSTFASAYDARFAIDAGVGSAFSEWVSNNEGAGSYLNLDLGAFYNLQTALLVDRVTSGSGLNTPGGGTGDFTSRFSLSFYANSLFTGAPTTFVFNHVAPADTTAPGAFAYAASLAGSPAVRYVRYTVLANQGLRPGLSDISFVADAVPESASWAMMIVGFGVVGAAARRRPKLVRVTHQA